MRKNVFAVAILSLMAVGVTVHQADAKRQNSSKTRAAAKAKYKAKNVQSKSAKSAKSGVQYIDGVAIISGGGSLGVSSDTRSRVSTNDVTITSGQVFTADNVQAISQKIVRDGNKRRASQEKKELARIAANAPKRNPSRMLPPQFTAYDTAGKKATLDQYKGRVVLLDFWATWCPPCRAEAPEIVKIYQKYNRYGFEILGLSLDSDAQALASFTRANGMTWRQVFGGANWDSPLARLYKIDHVPNNYLIAKDGTILAYDVHGEELDQAILAGLKEK